MDTINEQFRKEVGVISEDVPDYELENTIIPRALADINATCRQSFTISDYTEATVGSGEDYWELVDSIIALLACYEAWRSRKRATTTRTMGNAFEFPEYKSYLHDAWDMMGRIFPAVMKYEASRPGGGGYVPNQEEMHSSTKAHPTIYVGDSIEEGGIRANVTAVDVSQEDRI